MNNPDTETRTCNGLDPRLGQTVAHHDDRLDAHWVIIHKHREDLAMLGKRVGDNAGTLDNHREAINEVAKVARNGAGCIDSLNARLDAQALELLKLKERLTESMATLTIVTSALNDRLDAMRGPLALFGSHPVAGLLRTVSIASSATGDGCSRGPVPGRTFAG